MAKQDILNKTCGKKIKSKCTFEAIEVLLMVYVVRDKDIDAKSSTHEQLRDHSNFGTVSKC